jgi:Methyltransferase FkbM domain
MSQKMPDAYQVRVNYGYGMSALQQSPQQIQTRALAVVRAFVPRKVVGFEKVRLGRDSDGGYIHVDDFSGVEAALSFGISDDVSWDLDIARRNIPVHQFDHTIDKPPADNPKLFFHKKRVAASNEPGAMSLDSVVERFLAGCNRAILKIDIEGNEWAVFHAASTTTLARFSQIVCEFHGLQHAGDPSWSEHFLAVLRKLRSLFEVVHVHGNNAQPFINLGNLVLPTLLEVTFANRHDYQFAETDEIFPTALDRPNLPQVPEMQLGCFKF